MQHDSQARHMAPAITRQDVTESVTLQSCSISGFYDVNSVFRVVPRSLVASRRFEVINIPPPL
jgi:hypothetical protein